MILTRLSHQVLAVFMAVPPMIELTHSAPDLWRWFINLRWVRFITGRPAPEVLSPEEMGTPDAEFIDWQKNEKKGTVDSQSSFVTEQPWLGKAQQPNHSKDPTEKGPTEYGQSQVPRPFSHHFSIPHTSYIHNLLHTLDSRPEMDRYCSPFLSLPIKITCSVCRLR